MLCLRASFTISQGCPVVKETAPGYGLIIASFSESCLQLQGWWTCDQGSLTTVMGPDRLLTQKVTDCIFQDDHSHPFHQHAFLTVKPCYSLFRQWNHVPSPWTWAELHDLERILCNFWGYSTWHAIALPDLLSPYLLCLLPLFHPYLYILALET